MSEKLLRIMSAVLYEPWLLPPHMHRTLTDIASNHAASGEREAAQHLVAKTMEANPAKRQYEIVGRTAVIPGQGVFGRKFSSALYSSGVTSTDVFERLVRQAAKDEQVQSILLMMDSPGGYHMGVPEAARAVKEASAAKPVVAFVDGMCCSAAYWIASQADVIYAMESGDVGSIGCYIAFLDETRALELQGYRVDVFKSGRFKGMGLPGTTLSEEQATMLQQEVNDIASKFKAAVQAGRGGTIADDVMQGQSFTAEQAMSNGLIDGITDAETALRDAERLVEIRANKGNR